MVFKLLIHQVSKCPQLLLSFSSLMHSLLPKDSLFRNIFELRNDWSQDINVLHFLKVLSYFIKLKTGNRLEPRQKKSPAFSLIVVLFYYAENRK